MDLQCRPVVYTLDGDGAPEGTDRGYLTVLGNRPTSTGQTEVRHHCPRVEEEHAFPRRVLRLGTVVSDPGLRRILCPDSPKRLSTYSPSTSKRKLQRGLHQSWRSGSH